MSEIIQRASAAAWDEDNHAAQNRAQYNEKYAAVSPIFEDIWNVSAPPASFYLWPNIGADDEAFVRDLHAATNVVALPGSYLSRTAQGINPGREYVRISLVAPLDDCVAAAERIRDFVMT